MVKVPRQTRIVKRMLKKRNKKKKTKRLGDHVRPLSQAEQFANFLLSQKKDVPTNVLSKLPKRWFQSHGLRELERRKKVTKEERNNNYTVHFILMLTLFYEQSTRVHSVIIYAYFPAAGTVDPTDIVWPRVWMLMLMLML
mgnify:CR=1 FL=1